MSVRTVLTAHISSYPRGVKRLCAASRTLLVMSETIGLHVVRAVAHPALESPIQVFCLRTAAAGSAQGVVLGHPAALGQN